MGLPLVRRIVEAVSPAYAKCELPAAIASRRSVALGNSMLVATIPSLARSSGILKAGRKPKKRTVPMTIGVALVPGWAKAAVGGPNRLATRIVRTVRCTFARMLDPPRCTG